MVIARQDKAAATQRQEQSDIKLHNKEMPKEYHPCRTSQVTVIKPPNLIAWLSALF